MREPNMCMTDLASDQIKCGSLFTSIPKLLWITYICQIWNVDLGFKMPNQTCTHIIRKLT